MALRQLQEAAVVSAHYEIRMAGTLPPGALRDFEGLSESVHTAHTVLYGPLEDQAALRSLFERLEILGAHLLEIRRLQDENQPPERLPRSSPTISTRLPHG
jgi:hypothetical protein